MSQTIYVSSLLKDKYKDFSPEFFDEINRLKQAGNTVIWDAESIMDRAPNIDEAVDVIQDFKNKGYHFQVNYDTLKNRFKDQADSIAQAMRDDGFNVYQKQAAPAAPPKQPQTQEDESLLWSGLMQTNRLGAAVGLYGMEKAKQVIDDPQVAKLVADATKFVFPGNTPETVQRAAKSTIESGEGILKSQLQLTMPETYTEAAKGIAGAVERAGEVPSREKLTTKDFIETMEKTTPALNLVNQLATQIYAIPQAGMEIADAIFQTAIGPYTERTKGKEGEPTKWERPLSASMGMVGEVISGLAQKQGYSKEFGDQLGGIGGIAFLHYLAKGAKSIGKEVRNAQEAARIMEFKRKAQLVEERLNQEVQKAESLRENAGQVPQGGDVAERGAVEGGADLQRQAPVPSGNAEEAQVTHQMPTGEVMAGPEHPGAVPGSTQAIPAVTAPESVPVPEPKYVGIGKPKTYTNIVDVQKPDVGLRLKLERFALGEGNLFPGEGYLHRAWQKGGQAWSNRVNRFLYSIDYLKKKAGAKLTHFEDPKTRFLNNLGFNNKFFDTLENGTPNPANPGGPRISEGALNLANRLSEIKDQPFDQTYREAMEYSVAKATLAKKETFLRRAEQTPDVQERTNALNAVEKQDIAGKFSGIGEGKIPDTARANQIIKAIEANPQKAQIYSDFANRYKAIADSLIDYARDTGRISADQATDIKNSYSDYVSFKRLYDNIFRREGMETGTAPRQDHAVMHKYEGSNRVLEDPVVNLMQMTHDILWESDQNKVFRGYTDLADAATQADPRIGNSVIWEVPNKSQGTFTVYRDGQPHYYTGEAMLIKQIKGMESSPLDSNALTMAAQIFKGTVTHTPPFALINWMRAAMEYPLLSEHIKSPLDSVASTLELFTPEGKKLASEAAQYGLGAQWYMKDRANFYKLQQRVLGEHSKNPLTITATDLGKLADKYNKLISASELGPRMAEYKAVKEKAILDGMDEQSASAYAAARGADLPNFAIAGNLVRTLNRYIPFTNPAVQSMKTFVKAIYRNPGKALGMWATYMLLPRVLEYQWASQDPDRLLRWQNRPDYERDMFLHFELPPGIKKDGTPMPNVDISIPIGFEFSVLSSGMSRMLDATLGKNERAMSGWGGSLAKALIPIDPDSLLSSIMGLPFELGSGYDFFQRRFFISPDEQKTLPEYRSGAKYASFLSKTGARGYNWVLDQLKKRTPIDLTSAPIIGKQDPRNMDQIIRRMAGRVGTMTTSLSNVLSGEREPKSMLGPWVGLVRDLPAYAAKDVNEVALAAEKTKQAAELKKMREMKNLWYKEKDPEKKQMRLNELLRYARFLRDGKFKRAIENPESVLEAQGQKKTF